MDQLLAFINIINLLDWLPDWTLVEWMQWGIIGLMANVVLDLIAARRLFRGYVFVTHVDKARRAAKNQRLTTVQWLLSWDTGLGAAFWDFYCQVSYSKYFKGKYIIDFPKEMTLSKRLTRYLEGPDGRNKRIAEYIRDETGIDFFDYRGKHL